MTHNLYSSNIPSKVIGVQFSISSPDVIRNNSVCEIVSRDTYENNKPKIGGLFDPRMGILEQGLICPTDGQDYIDCPGYFGHIELGMPVFYIQYLNTIIKILKCVCFKCSKLLINKDKYKQALKMLPEERWNFVYLRANGINKCGQDTLDGCGCKQPSKIRKEGLATLYADFALKNTEDPENSDVNIKLTPELVLKIFKRITDDDIEFMGFSKTWSRPEWMICQVLAVPPPSIRPSIKHDAQQRSEDDLTHILINIIKTNNTLKDKLNSVNENVIEDWRTVLQYYCAILVDNKLPGVGQCCQRSGRPLKAIKDRLNAKHGRVRGNCMGKRVDYSARSVITADPNLSIRELGIPLKIAKNITKPVKVNERNKVILTKLVMNGPDVWPGAKILQKSNGREITLRYIDKSAVSVEIGDTVHRHMMDGDPILFNRQPTLHRMSMMAHIAKIMHKGDTFRMNVADTKPYNADFDGDEMNLHMPQDVESDAELYNLAAVPYQLISPANNSTIVGIFQDSLLGAYQFTRNNGVKISKREAMNLLMNYTNIDINKLKDIKEITSYDILSQICPRLSLNSKNKENTKLTINNGEFVEGQLDKGTLGSSSIGLLHRICNDYSNMVCSEFIDNFQSIITDYMKTSSFSVGISDLKSDDVTKKEIQDVINKKKKEVRSLIEKVEVGLFSNDTGKSNSEEFEVQVNNILNKATAESGEIGRKKLSKQNNFVTMVNAGSKGSELNLSFMISCLGQQNVNGKRIPYGFDYRTLPHFTKFDDSPKARGFVESSYIDGLSPEELFFHAMGGRTGLIDTAVKTSQTGYIQRRLIKGMEDLKLEYDMTVRNNKGKIVQYLYGDDGIDTCKIERQINPLVSMSDEDIYMNYFIDEDTFDNIDLSLTKKINSEKPEYLKKVVEYSKFNIYVRDTFVENVNKNISNDKIYLPVNFKAIINNVYHQIDLQNENNMVDMTPLECLNIIEKNFNGLELPYIKPNLIFKMMYFYHLSPKNLFSKRFNRITLSCLLENINLSYKRAILAPGEMVGMIAAQSIGEPTTQMTLNTFHFAGVSSKSNVTRGVPRIEEILALSANTKNPSLTIYLKENDETDKEKASNIVHMIENTCLIDLVKYTEICYENDVFNTTHDEDNRLVEQFYEFEKILKECNNEELNENPNMYKWIIRIKLDDETMLDKNITINDIHFAIKSIYKNEVSCCFSDYNDNNLVFRIHVNKIKDKNKEKKTKSSQDQSDDIHYIKNFQDNLLKKIVLRGTRKIDKVILRKLQGKLVKQDNGKYVSINELKNNNNESKTAWVLDTVGTNLMEILGLDFIDSNKTVTTDIMETYNVLGIEAARQTIYNELSDVIEFDGGYINSHHMELLCDRMCYSTTMVSIFRHGINNDNIGPIAKASFEETPEMFLKAARHGELDNMRGVSSNVMCGQLGYYGTSSFQVLIDTNKLQDITYDRNEERSFNVNLYKSNNQCNNIVINNDVTKIKSKQWTNDDDYIPDGL
jgi:DNA-directed RNA polymerase II subunit RPB1